MVSLSIDVHTTKTPLSAERRAELMSNPAFGRIFTEHMLTIPYRRSSGWGSAELGPYRPIQLDPAASVLHYGQSVFEGFKAFRQIDDSIATFRPEANGLRFQASARRLAMPELPVEAFIDTADALIRHERSWVPSGRGRSLYIRPLLVATEPGLGVKPADDYLFILFGSPAGSYFRDGVQPVSVWICEDYSRAAPGGTGAIKCSGNYAASLIAQDQAVAHDCEQVVWLDAVSRRNVEEMGGMNIFFVYSGGTKSKLVTPRLTGSLLPGVTRDSLLRLGADLGYEVQEQTVTLEQWIADATSGEMTEAFACGTAAVITPIGAIKSTQTQVTMGGGGTGPVAQRLRDCLLDVQYGVSRDTHGWMHPVC